MSFDESAAERWYQNRQSRQRTASADNPTQRLRNTSVGIWEKGYTGGPLREGVSDRRSEWMGGGMGGRLGEDWRNIAPNTVARQGSGLDPISAAVVGRFKKRSANKRLAKRGLNVPAAEAETEEGAVEPVAEAVEPAVTKPKRTMTPEQRTKANERRRALTAERKEAVQKVGTMGDWSGSGVLMQGANPPWLET